MSENQHIYKDLNKSPSARPGGSQQWKILLSPNSKRAPNFSGAEILPRRGDFNVRHSSIVRLNFYQAHKILDTRLNFVRRLNFPQEVSARIFCRNFLPKFSA
jgi:hypothetical protein